MIEMHRVFLGASSHAAHTSAMTLWRNRSRGLGAGQSLLSASTRRLTANVCSLIFPAVLISARVAESAGNSADAHALSYDASLRRT
ncbi:hypothetical protein HYPDE_28223 [Hyphomicrobium denitrificans 1NES1]|uniref:Uncharacterized protein n=1 Tax=Hyphomicrobium denitrificans 1NES1 TaxID=670307 RepID=N0B1F8_9HYPH|nr:hypothetical protein HYPDE_28223 [Hyphomicrobium denitrificans 1NES1]